MSLIVNTKNFKTNDTGHQRQINSFYADTNGDGSGTFEAVGNYSSAPVSFSIKPKAGEILRIARLIVFIEDSGAMDSGFYGNGIVLTNGIKFMVRKNGVENHSQSTAQAPVKTNGDLASLCHDLTYASWGAGNTYITARWTYTKFGQYIRLKGDNSDSFNVILNDNFTGLIKHRFCVQGYYE